MPLIANIIPSVPENSAHLAAEYIPGIENIPGSSEKIEKFINEIISFDEAAFYYRIFDCTSVENDRITVSSGLELDIEKAAEIFGRPEKIMVYFATVGPEADRKMSIMNMQDNAFDAYLYKNVASMILNSFTDDCKNAVSAKILSEQGMKTGCSYSPGYQFWKIEEQEKLFTLADPSCIGISLDESSIMHPSISVSGIFCAGNEINEKSVTCSFCDEEYCYLKKMKGRD